jgi:hypothetical protein
MRESQEKRRRRKKLNILEACRDPKLFGLVLDDIKSWMRWLVFAQVVFGLPLTKQEREIARHHTGRDDFGKKGF